VSPGTYYENINFRGKNIVVTSLYYLASDTSYIISTVINGSTPLNPDTASCVIFNSGEDTTAILQGFTITGGTGTKWTDIHGAGIFREGGGILIELSSPTVMHNVIINNQVTDITGVTSAGGGGIRIGDGDPKIYCNILRGNQGRYGAGIVLNYTACRIRNNIITENTGGQSYYGGSGIWILGDMASSYKFIDNNTITANSASLSGGTGGISIWSSNTALIRNNIIWGNSPSAQIKNIGSIADISYNDVLGGYAGTGNINLDPAFLPDDFFLSATSPCIDAGNPDIGFNDKEDPANPGSALFPSKGTVVNDMGAYGGPYASLFPHSGTVTGIDDVAVTQPFLVTPNPWSQWTMITSDQLQPGDVVLVYDLLGKTCLEKRVVKSQSLMIERGILVPGMYLFKIYSGGKEKGSGRFVIRN